MNFSLPILMAQRNARSIPLDKTSADYLNHLTSLSISDLTTLPNQLLSPNRPSLILRSVRALSKRSHKSIATAATELDNLSTQLPALEAHSRSLNSAIPALESRRRRTFADKYRKPNDSSNPVLACARRNALSSLSRNVDRVSSHHSSCPPSSAPPPCLQRPARTTVCAL